MYGILDIHMLIRQLFHIDSCSYSYLLACQKDVSAIIIDPVLEQGDTYLHLLERLGVTLKYSMETHIHADHISGASWLKDQTNCTLLMPNQSRVNCCDEEFTDGSQISFGKQSLICLHTPGHTDDSYCFYSKKNKTLFTGDTLLINGSGRTDFENSNSSDAYASLNKIASLPGDTIIYPAHDYQGLNVSVLSEEIRYNPRLQFKSNKEFTAHMKTQGGDMPQMFDIAIPANKNCGMQ